MYDRYFQTLRSKVPFTDEDLAIIEQHLTTKRLRRKQYLLQEGDVCRFTAFVEKGALRSYTVNERGGEHIIQFALEGWTIGDLYSFLTGEPATYTIDALEDSELVMISREAHEELLRTVPKYETHTRLTVTGAYIAMQRRITASMIQTIEERYSAFIDKYPDIVQRVPQHMIASYLGLTPETLSRVRRKISAKGG